MNKVQPPNTTPPGTVERILVLDYLALPAEQQERFRHCPGFGNNRFIEYGSADFGPEPGQTWATSFTSSAMQHCLAVAQARGFDGGLQPYIAQHDPFLGWLMAEGVDFNVTRILVRIYG